MNFHGILSAFVGMGIVIATLGAVATAKDGKKLHIGVDGTHPPFSHANLDGEISGLDIDVARAVCKLIKVDCTLEKFKWDNLIAALRAKKIDMVIATIRENPQNLKLVDFSTAYLQIPSAIIVTNTSKLSGIDVDDLRDKQIGVLKSSPHGEYIRTHRPATVLKLYEDEKEYFDDLINKQVDGVIGNPIVLDNWLQSKDGLRCCRMLDTLPHDPQINGEGFAIAVAKGNDNLLKRLNKALKTMAASGELAEIIRAHLPYLR